MIFVFDKFSFFFWFSSPTSASMLFLFFFSFILWIFNSSLGTINYRRKVSRDFSDGSSGGGGGGTAAAGERGGGKKISSSSAAVRKRRLSGHAQEVVNRLKELSTGPTFSKVQKVDGPEFIRKDFFSSFFKISFFFPWTFLLFFLFLLPPNPVPVIYNLIFLSSSGTNSGAIKHNNSINAAREEVGGPKHRTWKESFQRSFFFFLLSTDNVELWFLYQPTLQSTFQKVKKWD